MSLTKQQKIEKATKYANTYSPSDDHLRLSIQADRHSVFIAGFLQGFECAGGTHADIPSEELIKRSKNAERHAEQAEFIRRRFADIVPGLTSASWEDIWERVREAVGDKASA